MKSMYECVCVKSSHFRWTVYRCRGFYSFGSSVRRLTKLTAILYEHHSIHNSLIHKHRTRTRGHTERERLAKSSS